MVLIGDTQGLSLWPRCEDHENSFKLYFDSSDPCETLDRAWFGEMWFPVQRQACQVQTSVSEANIYDPADLDMDYGCDSLKNPTSASPSLKYVTQPMLFWTVERHMFYCQGTCCPRVQGHLKSLSILQLGRRRLCVGEMKSMHKKGHILYLHWVRVGPGDVRVPFKGHLSCRI